MATDIREFRQMLEAGRRYLAGTCSIQELNGRVNELSTAARFWRGHPALTEIAGDGSAMVDRRWNEWGHNSNPLSEEEFAAWLEDQLSSLGQMPNNSLKPMPPRGAP